jgi:hypothetical protein
MWMFWVARRRAEELREQALRARTLSLELRLEIAELRARRSLERGFGAPDVGHDRGHAPA